MSANKKKSNKENSAKKQNLSNKQDTILEGRALTSLLKLSWPIVLANVIQSAYQFTDAFWVGRLGGDGMAAISVSIPAIFLFTAIGAGLSMAGSILVAQYKGAGSQELVDKAAGQTLLMVTVLSILLSVTGLLLTPFYLDIMNLTPDVYKGALGYLRFSLSGILFTLGFFMFQALMRGAGEVKLPLHIVTGAVLLNFIIDPLLIFGWGFIPSMGVAGAALSTLLTQGIALAVGCATLLTGKWGIKLRLNTFKPDVTFIRRGLSLGLPAATEMLSNTLNMNVMIFLVAGFGTVITAVYGVVVNIIGFVMIPALGISMATTTLVGQNIGAKQHKRAADISRLSAWLSFVIMTILGLLIFFFAADVIAFFVPNDQAVIKAGEIFLHIISLSFGFIGVQMALSGALRAAGNTIAPMVLSGISRWLLQFPFAFILSVYTPLGALGIWWAYTVTFVLTAVMTVFWYIKCESLNPAPLIQSHA